jgi:CheY-like chemotaxis protein
MTQPMRALSVLLVEDDVAHAEITRRNLQDLGPRLGALVHVSDGQAALDHLSEAQQERSLPDLILLDLRLPRLDGLEVLAYVKHDRALKHIPVIVLTTSSADGDLQAAYARGANSYLVKPLDHDSYLELTQALGTYWFDYNRIPES